MSDDTTKAAAAARLREKADREAVHAARHPSLWPGVEYLRDRADRIEAGGITTAEDFVEDYNDEAMRLHTTGHVEELVQHAKKWEVEIRADAYARALNYLASAHANVEANGERRAAEIVAGWLVKASDDLLDESRHNAGADG